MMNGGASSVTSAQKRNLFKFHIQRLGYGNTYTGVIVALRFASQFSRTYPCRCSVLYRDSVAEFLSDTCC